MAQQLSDIYASLNSAYNPQRDVYNQQLGQVDQQSQGAIAGVNAQKDTAFQGINNQANANGMFYSGAPIKEQQMYTGGTYAPAYANIQNAAQNQKYSLQGALAGVGVNQTNQANQIYDTQMGQDQQQRQYQQSFAQQAQFNAANLAMSNAYNQRMSGGGGGGGGVGAAPAAAGGWNIGKDSNNGLAITNNGKAASAGAYARANNQDIADVLGKSGIQQDQLLASQIRMMKQTGNTNGYNQLAQSMPWVFR